MRKGIIIDIKDQYTYVLYKNAKIKKIKREYNHEIGHEISFSLPMKKTIPLLVLSCFLFIAFVFNPFYHQPVQALSYITLNVNPGLVFEVDDYKVVGIRYMNKDGQNLISKIDFLNHSLDESLYMFIDYCFEYQLFNQNNNIDINVLCDDESQIQDIENNIQNIIHQYLKTHQKTIHLSLDEVSKNQENNAKDLGVANSKIKLIDYIVNHYPQYNKNDLVNESIDDLLDLLEEKGYDEDILDRLEDSLEEDDDDDEEDDD